MHVIGAVLVFVGLVCTGMLGGIFWMLMRLARRREEQHAQVMDRAAEQHRAQVAKLHEMSTEILGRAHLIAAGLAAEIREMAASHRNDLRLATCLPSVSVPGQRGRKEAPSSPSERPTLPAISSAMRPSAPEPAAHDEEPGR